MVLTIKEEQFMSFTTGSSTVRFMRSLVELYLRFRVTLAMVRLGAVRHSEQTASVDDWKVMRGADCGTVRGQTRQAGGADCLTVWVRPLNNNENRFFQRGQF